MSKSIESSLISAFASKKIKEVKDVSKINESKKIETKVVESKKVETKINKPVVKENKKFANEKLSKRYDEAFKVASKVATEKFSMNEEKNVSSKSPISRESLNRIRGVIGGLKEGSIISKQDCIVIRENLMNHLYEAIMAGMKMPTTYRLIVQDIAPIMQVTESVILRKGKVSKRDASIYEAYIAYLDAMQSKLSEMDDGWDDEDDSDEDDIVIGTEVSTEDTDLGPSGNTTDNPMNSDDEKKKTEEEIPTDTKKIPGGDDEDASMPGKVI
jgi:hypothetical protein